MCSCGLLREGLLDLARVDAADEGGGQRAYELWKHDFVVFQATGHIVYAGLAFQFMAQVDLLLGERKATQLLHNRTVTFLQLVAIRSNF